MRRKGKLPWFKFFPQDWRSDIDLRQCSPAARGLWIDLLCLMHEAEPYGHLATRDGQPMDAESIAACVAGWKASEVTNLMEELERRGVFSKRNNGVFYCRRMVKDEERRDTQRECMRRLRNEKGNVNTQLTTSEQQVSAKLTGEARGQKPEARDNTQSATGPGGGAIAQELRAKALDVFSHYQAKTKRPGPAVPAELAVIMDRLRDSFTVENCKAVIDEKTRQWIGDAKSRTWLFSVSTVFSPAKFAGYLQEANYNKPKPPPLLPQPERYDPLADQIRRVTNSLNNARVRLDNGDKKQAERVARCEAELAELERQQCHSTKPNSTPTTEQPPSLPT